MTKIINLFAGPGAGKSTLASGLFFDLKMSGYSCELVTEYAKDLTWEERFNTLKIQPYIFGKQYHRLQRLLGKVDIIVTDSPILMSVFYAGQNYPASFKEAVKDMFLEMENQNFFIERKKEYVQTGRNQDLIQAKEIDACLLRLLFDCQVPYRLIQGSTDGLKQLIELVK